MRNRFLVFACLGVVLALAIVLFRRSDSSVIRSDADGVASATPASDVGTTALTDARESPTAATTPSKSARAPAIESLPPTKRDTVPTQAVATASEEVVRTASDTVDAHGAELDDEELDAFLTTKYAGWSEAQMTEAIGRIETVCRAIEATPELFKTQQQEYVALNREIAWLKENRVR